MRKTRIKWEDYHGTPVSEMFDLVWFWPLKPHVRPIVSLSQCCNPPQHPTPHTPPHCSGKRGEKGKVANQRRET